MESERDNRDEVQSGAVKNEPKGVVGRLTRGKKDTKGRYVSGEIKEEVRGGVK